MKTQTDWKIVAEVGPVRLVRNPDGHALTVFTDERRYTVLYEVSFGLGTPDSVIFAAFEQTGFAARAGEGPGTIYS